MSERIKERWTQEVNRMEAWINDLRTGYQTENDAQMVHISTLQAGSKTVCDVDNEPLDVSASFVVLGDAQQSEASEWSMTPEILEHRLLVEERHPAVLNGFNGDGHHDSRVVNSQPGTPVTCGVMNPLLLPATTEPVTSGLANSLAIKPLVNICSHEF